MQGLSVRDIGPVQRICALFGRALANVDFCLPIFGNDMSLFGMEAEANKKSSRLLASAASEKYNLALNLLESNTRKVALNPR
jgi:hypothetical protein